MISRQDHVTDFTWLGYDVLIMMNQVTVTSILYQPASNKLLFNHSICAFWCFYNQETVIKDRIQEGLGGGESSDDSVENKEEEEEKREEEKESMPSFGF